MRIKKQKQGSASPSDAELLGERLRIARGSLQREDLAARIGISFQTLGNYERGGRVPDMLVGARICRETGVEPRWLLLGEGEERRVERGPVPYDPEKMQFAMELAGLVERTGRLPEGRTAAEMAREIYEFFVWRGE